MITAKLAEAKVEWLTREEAVALLARLGINTSIAGLAQRHSRASQDAPPCEVNGNGRVLYRRDLLEEWARRYTRSRIDLTKTTLGRWMLKHGYTARTFALHLELGQALVRNLLGHRNAASNASMVLRTDILRLISLETNIPIGVLVEDATKGD